ncbi:MAG: flagellar basal body P-ring protein FlgI [Planctomycetota bacterium]
MTPLAQAARAAILIGMLTAAGLISVGCGPPRRTTQVDVPTASRGSSVLRGTIGREAVLRNADPVIVSGYGLVVGLAGTGARDVPANVAATMEREIETLAGGLGGVDFQGTAFEGLSPRQIMRDPSTAVVLVVGAVSPGGPEGLRFDVQVRALSGSSATSLEGGRLWTTRLQIGRPVTLGGPQTEIIAEARGEIFINPFATPGSSSVEGRVGRVLGGGLLTDPRPLELVLENPLHSRAMGIERAINQRFPDGPAGPGTVAYGRNDQIVQVYTPTAFQQRFDEFVRTLLATPIDQSAPEALARRYRQAMVNQPELAADIGWALRAIGEPSLSHMRDLYDFPEIAPRMAALTVGAHLNDTRAADFLERVALEGSAAEQLAAIELLGAVDGRPSSDDVLRDLAGFGETLTVRSMAADALMRRAERWRLAQLAAAERQRAVGRRPATETQLRLAAARRIPRGNPQGVERVDVAGRFAIDRLPFGEPLVFVTLQGVPRIVLFGERAELTRPMTVAAWDNRLLMRSDGPRDEVLLRYEDDRTGRVIQRPVGHELLDVVLFLARGAGVSDFGEGLGFTYAQVVGALAAIEESSATRAAFATQEDRFQAMLALASDRNVADRPALLDDEGVRVDLGSIEPLDPSERAAPKAEGGFVVPIERDEDDEG